MVFRGLQPCLPLLSKNCWDNALLWLASLPPESLQDAATWLRCFPIRPGYALPMHFLESLVSSHAGFYQGAHLLKNES
jgi:hypothetical protein